MSYNVSAILDAQLAGKPESSVEATLAQVAAQIGGTSTAEPAVADEPEIDLEKPLEAAPEPAPAAEPTPEPEPEEPAAEPEPAEEAAQEPAGEPEPEPEAQPDPRDALFAQLRVQFPNESFESIGRRVEAALGTPEAAPQPEVAVVFDEILNEFAEAQKSLEAAREAFKAIEQEAEENGAVIEFNGHTRETYEAVKAAEAEVAESFKNLQLEAFQRVEAEFPELADDAPDGPAKQLFSSMLISALRVDKKFDAHDPTLAPRMAREAAQKAREMLKTIPAAPQPPKPAPPRKAAPASRMPSSLPGSVQAPNAPVGAPANGQTPPPSLAARLQTKSLQELAAETFGGGQSIGGIF